MDQETYDKIPWIDINLPWKTNISWDEEPLSPSLDDREREVFGISLVELEEANRHNIDGCVELQNKLDEIKDEARTKVTSYSEYLDGLNKLEDDFWAEHAQDPCVVGRDAYIELRDRMHKWGEEQPEWKAWQKVREEFITEQNQKCFSGRKLDRPGTLIEMEDGAIHMIGTINTAGGCCNDCPAFEDGLVVKRYAMVYPFTMRKANEDFYTDK